MRSRAGTQWRRVPEDGGQADGSGKMGNLVVGASGEGYITASRDLTRVELDLMRRMLWRGSNARRLAPVIGRHLRFGGFAARWRGSCDRECITGRVHLGNSLDHP